MHFRFDIICSKKQYKILPFISFHPFISILTRWTRRFPPDSSNFSQLEWEHWAIPSHSVRRVSMSLTELVTDSGQVHCDIKRRKLKRGKIGITSHIKLKTHQSKSDTYLKVLVPSHHTFFRKRSPTKKIRPPSLSRSIQERRNHLLSAVISSQKTLKILQARLTWTLESNYDPHSSSLQSWIE